MGQLGCRGSGGATRDEVSSAVSQRSKRPPLRRMMYRSANFTAVRGTFVLGSSRGSTLARDARVCSRDLSFYAAYFMSAWSVFAMSFCMSCIIAFILTKASPWACFAASTTPWATLSAPSPSAASVTSTLLGWPWPS